MAKFSDAVRNTMISYFNIGDQPTEAQFTALITAIQEGIEEHQHDGTGDGDGIADLGPLSSLEMANAAWIGIGAALERFEFNVAGNISILGAAFKLGDDSGYFIGTPTHGHRFNNNADAITIVQMYNSGGVSVGDAFANNDPGADILIVEGRLSAGVLAPAYKLDIYDVGAEFVAGFFNDGDHVDRYGLRIQCGADNGAAVGTTHYFYCTDGDGTGTGGLKTVDGVFQLYDASDERRKANIVDTELVGLDIIKGLRVRDYNWKANPKGPVMTSFVAQEAQKVFPAMVGEDLDGTLGTSRTTLIPILVKAIQEQQAQIEVLQRRT